MFALGVGNTGAQRSPISNVYDGQCCSYSGSVIQIDTLPFRCQSVLLFSKLTNFFKRYFDPEEILSDDEKKQFSV